MKGESVKGYYRVLLLIAALVAVFFAVVGQVSLNHFSSPLNPPLFHWNCPGCEWLRFSLGGKISSLLYPALIIWLVGWIWDKELRPTRSDLGRPVLIFLGIVALAWIFSPYRGMSWKTGGKDLFTQVGWFFLLTSLLRRERYRKILLAVLFGALGIALLAGIRLYYRGIYFPQTPLRIWLSFGHPNSTGAVLVLLLPLSFALILSPAPRRLRVAAGAVTLILGWGLYLSFSRTAWVSLLAGLAILTFSRKGKFIFLGLIILLAVLFIWGLNVGPQSYWKQRIKSFSTWRSDPNIRKRLIYSGAALRMIRDRPLIGYGPGYGIFQRLYREKYKKTETGEFATAPHNYYLSLTLATGLLGLAAFAWLVFRVFSLARKGVGSRAPPDWFASAFRRGLIAGLAAFLIGSLADDPLLNERISFLFWTLLGSLAASQVTATRSD